MSIEQKDKNPPFRDDLVDISFGENTYNHIKALRNNPSKIVRRERYYDDENSLNDFRIARRLFRELTNNYEILVPNLDYVVGYDLDKTLTVYVVADKIYGNNVGEMYQQEKKIPKDQIEKLCIRLMDYFEEKYHNGGEFLFDIAGLGQYVYGHKYREENDNLYLVDTQPLYDNIQPKRMSTLFFSIASGFSPLVKSCESLAGTHLAKARARLEKFYKNIPLGDPATRLEDLKE